MYRYKTSTKTAKTVPDTVNGTLTVAAKRLWHNSQKSKWETGTEKERVDVGSKQKAD